MHTDNIILKAVSAAFLAAVIMLSGCAEKMPAEVSSVSESISEADTQTEEQAETETQDSEPEKREVNEDRYYLYKFETGDYVASHEDIEAMGLDKYYVELRQDGTGEISILGSTADLKWEDDGRLFVDTYADAAFEQYGDVLHVISFASVYTFVRDGVEADHDNIPAVKGTGLRYYLDPGDWGGGKEYETETDTEEESGGDYESSVFYKRLTEPHCGGSIREYVVALAKSQLWYHEGNSENDLCGLNALGDREYTEYGRYCNSQGTYWGSEFVTWCVRMSGLPFDSFADSTVANASHFTDGTSARYYEWSDTAYAGGTIYPRKGDILLFKFNSEPCGPDDSVDQAVLVEYVTPPENGIITFRIIQGNAEGAVLECDYEVYESDGGFVGSDGRIAYIVVPDYDYGATIPDNLQFMVEEGYLESVWKHVYDGGLYGPLPIPVSIYPEDGPDFDGWYTEPEGGTKVTMYSIYKADGTGRKKIYAHWK